MQENHEQQLMRVLAEMVASGEIKTTLINGETHYYIEKNVQTAEAPLELQRLIDDEDTIKIFRDGDIGYPVRYAAPVNRADFIASASAFEGKRDELIRKFKALL